MSEINTREFMAAFDAMVEKTGKNADEAVRDVATQIYRGILRGWPVDTGRSRNNWQIGIDQAPTNVLDGTGDPQGRELPKLNGVQGDTEIYFVNNVQYAERLENGWSQQAPSGAVRITLTRFEQIMNVAARNNQL